MASSSVTFSASQVQIQGYMGKYPLRDGNAIRDYLIQTSLQQLLQ